MSHADKKGLKLPIIRGLSLESKWLSMDDYLTFVTMNLKYTYNKSSNRRWKKMLAVNVPFHIAQHVTRGRIIK